jgi:catechol 2,3-dioxygenase-like lactoylglutathione lyase family enzyme
VEFYRKYFGFSVVLNDRFPEGFFDAKPSLYRLKAGAGSKIAILKSPEGVMLELFQFIEQTPHRAPEWNTPGYHHICLKVPDVNAKYREMSAAGVEFYFEPDYMGDPADNKFWVFLKDPDGNMIELQ